MLRVCRKNAGFSALLYGLLAVASLVFYPSAQVQAETIYSENFAAADPAIADDAIMIIRFNKKNVYYQNELKKVVDTVSGVRPEAVYEVQHIIPETLKDSVSDRESKEKLRDAVKGLVKFGVPIDNIKTNTTYSGNIKTQEIRIFVR